ncbi:MULTISPECIES: hypothetical protein [Pseudoalteromonas]|uniref:hypothetical protein n=1 Tax=Pseudoalteromonas TaxID=53246 RepID=UPI000FFE42A2|nr:MULTISPECIES: hypothetical protein [Pseudoalteromonas]MCG9761535.1 hypothetical protein [Pseudoalteromonas sp. Isolate6]NKC19403.1 hypothetical protein [Pseudoalteromonas galatheae]RXE86717.1 hypothetical protein DRB05_10800 [Pseudoalteromonas sp. A757]
MKTIIIVAATSFLFACSSTDNSQAEQSVANKKIEMNCEVSSMTGSKLKRKRCVDKKQAEYERENARRLIRDAENNTATTDR